MDGDDGDGDDDDGDDDDGDDDDDTDGDDINVGDDDHNDHVWCPLSLLLDLVSNPHHLKLSLRRVGTLNVQTLKFYSICTFTKQN